MANKYHINTLVTYIPNITRIFAQLRFVIARTIGPGVKVPKAKKELLT